MVLTAAPLSSLLLYFGTLLKTVANHLCTARQGKFEARFYHKVFEEEIGRVRGHFGPLSKLFCCGRFNNSNRCTDTVAVDPLGRGYASGGEDGYVRVHQFDKGYFDFTYEVERQAKAQGQM